MIISEHKETEKNKHWSEVVEPLHIYRYSDVFDDQLYGSLKNAVISRIENKTSELTYLTHRTTFNFNNRKMHIVSHKENDRVQDVVYDLTFVKDYWYQTKDTIYDWSWDYLRQHIHPLFYKYLTTFKNVVPTSNEPNSYIPFRWHLNYLDYSEYLFMHVDCNSQYFNTPVGNFARARSLTFYLYDHIPNYGGELYFLSGYVYKPKQNEAVSINGNATVHGVNSNMNPDKKPRLAFTTRWAHKDDLYLPGDPDNAMYKLELL
jgi:hypothetical protein